MTAHIHSVPTEPTVIHPALSVTTGAKVEQAYVAARFLDSLGIAAQTVHVTALGRVECMVEPAELDRARRVLVSEGGTFHDEGGFVYVEARIEGVPVQVWAAAS